ncbi:hypothetical protein DOTSEDRAFT_70318 [Dothistroma septosporum NZE10]|uniref:AAA+ ATPase domain-containing protein n=1 Tax=Dothistroma septosporum (strain NZE10 / CBS 128990) TaxID=675120 RepID=N1PS43_DOTSN|nr:hypothetical protein DOTSEDRAFT_70318 [Dothistroma septosporum NZE10]
MVSTQPAAGSGENEAKEILNGLSGSSPANGPNLVKKLYGIANERGGTSWVDECPDYLQSPSQHSDHAIVTRYKENKAGSARKTLDLASIDIHSPYLQDVVRQVFKTYPGAEIDEANLTFNAPFHSLFHQWPMFQSVHDQAKQQQSEHFEEIKALLDVLNEEFGLAMENAKTLAKKGSITFALAWTLFPPGCPVFGSYKKRKHCCLIHEVKYLMAETVPLLSIDLICLDHDGHRFGWQRIKHVIEAFGGTRMVTDLPVIPIHLDRNSLGTLKSLTERGATAVSLVEHSPVYKGYEGTVRLHSPWLDLEEIEVYVEGRCIVDAKMHAQQASRYCPSVSTKPHRLDCLLTRDESTKLVIVAENSILSFSDNMNRHPVLSAGSSTLKPKVALSDQDSSGLRHHRWTETFFGIPPEAFCTSTVRGYCLVSKSWAEFDIDCMQDIRWNKNAFDALVIPPARKRLLEAMIRQQQQRKMDDDMDDVVSGKGQGLIMLLAGPPGTGKTLTAESVADRLHLPLYAVSAGELGDTDKEIEAQFGQILRLAAHWDAVLLLDEADAFLEKRIDLPEARSRNKRVAAFLRILEYYKGILILTTNRSVNFDDAFYSRIHLCLTFKSLDHKSREDIWKNFIRGADISEADLSTFASEPLNGRQIKNVMKMARLLATDEGSSLSGSHIKVVLAVATEDLEVSPSDTN